MEVMIVVVIIAALVATVLPRVGNQNNQLKEAIRRFTVLTKELRHRARLENATYRLVIDMKDGWEKGEIPHQYWVEKSTQRVILPGPEEEEKELEKDESGNPIDPNGFAIEERVMKRQNLPKPLFFESVEIASEKAPLVSGVAYIHFFPQGLVDEAAVHFRLHEKARWTLAIHPLTGKSEIVTEFLELKDIRDQ
jgi:general secretion pathway protein H